MKEQHGLAVDVRVTGDVPVPGEDLRLLLFQVVRELLFNVVKHDGEEHRFLQRNLCSSPSVFTSSFRVEGRLASSTIRRFVAAYVRASRPQRAEPTMRLPK
jgi:hypothetical protein